MKIKKVKLNDEEKAFIEQIINECDNTITLSMLDDDEKDEDKEA